MSKIKIFVYSFIILVAAPTLASLLVAYCLSVLPYQKNEHTKIYYVYVGHNDDNEYLLDFNQSQGEKCLTYNGLRMILVGKRYGSLGFGVPYKNKIEECR